QVSLRDKCPYGTRTSRPSVHASRAGIPSVKFLCVIAAPRGKPSRWLQIGGAMRALPGPGRDDRTTERTFTRGRRLGWRARDAANGAQKFHHHDPEDQRDQEEANELAQKRAVRHLTVPPFFIAPLAMHEVGKQRHDDVRDQ